MIGYPWAQQPDQKIGNEVAPCKDGSTDAWVKVEEHSSQKKQRQRIGHQVGNTAMNQWCGEYANKPGKGPWHDSQPAKINMIEELETEYRPHEEDQSEWYNGTAEERVATHEIVNSQRQHAHSVAD